MGVEWEGEGTEGHSQKSGAGRWPGCTQLPCTQLGSGLDDLDQTGVLAPFAKGPPDRWGSPLGQWCLNMSYTGTSVEDRRCWGQAGQACVSARGEGTMRADPSPAPPSRGALSSTALGRVQCGGQISSMALAFPLCGTLRPNQLRALPSLGGPQMRVEWNSRERDQGR